MTASVQAQTTRLPADTVRRKPNRELDEVLVQGRYFRHYNPQEVSPTLRVQTPLLKLSQNLQIVTSQVLQDQQVLSLTEGVARNVSGTTRNNIADFYSASFIMRGAAISPLRNGVDITPLDAGPFPEDAAFIERIEFIKGPAGFMNAIGDPAGSFNVVTKQPTGHNRQTVSLTGGSFDLYRATADVDGLLGSSGKLQYRLNSVAMKTNSFVKFNFNDKLLLAPVLRYQFSPNTSLTAEYVYQRVRFQQYSPTVFSPRGFASLPLNFTLTDPNLDPYHLTEQTGFLTLRHAFSKNWSVTGRGSWLRNYTDGRYLFVRDYKAATPTILQRTIINEDFLNTVYSAQGFVNGTFATGPVGHRFLAGVDANWRHFTGYRGYLDNSRDKTVYPLDIDNPVYGITIKPYVKNGSLDERANTIQDLKYQSAYVQEEADFFDDKLRVTVAGRLTHAKATSDNRTAVFTADNTVFTPRFGLSYSVLPSLSVYGVLDHTFTPQVGTASIAAFEPLRGRNLEAGVKKDWLDGLWNTTAAVYTIRRQNQIVTDANNVQSQLGETVSKGIEFDLKGQLAPGLNVVANYAYTDAKITADAVAANVGLAAPYTVKHVQNTWVNYALPFRHVRGLGVLVGYQYQAGRAGRYAADNVPGIANNFQLDAGATYTLARLSVNLLVNNVLNHTLYGSAWTRPVPLYAYVPLPPRNFRLTLAYRFGHN